jgi:hypothetical protein
VALSTLALAKIHLGITGTANDTALTQWLAQAVSMVRRETGRWLGGMISSNTVADPTIITSIGHGLQTGDLIVIRGSNCTPSIDGEQTVTEVSRDTFSVDVAVTVAGTAGYYGRKITEYYGGDDTDLLLLRQRPVQSISSVYVDSQAFYGEASGAFDSSTLLVAGTDYALLRDGSTTRAEKSSIGGLVRIGNVWPAVRKRDRGHLSSYSGMGLGNIKVTSTIGYAVLPDDIVGMVNTAVAILQRTAATGASLASESLEYYSYSLAQSTSGNDDMVASLKRMIGRYKEVLV